MNKIDSIEVYIAQFLKDYKPYKTTWCYEDGCVLKGCEDLYQVTKDKKYVEYIQKLVDSHIAEDGTITNYKLSEHSIDNVSCSRVLFKLYDLTKDEKYRKALDFTSKQLAEQPRCKCGNFWHKDIYPNQVWLDGLYMAQPIYMEYETRWNQKEGCQDVVNQFAKVRQKLWDAEHELYYHAWDESCVQPWANPKTGTSKNFWLRAEGWYLMALADTMDVMSKELYEQYRTLEDLLREGVNGILQYIDPKNHMFYQVIDHPDTKGNYLETSGSVMIAYAILKGIRLGVFDRDAYETIGKTIFEGVVETYLHQNEDGKWHLGGICKVAGLGPGEKRDGSVEYYLSEPIVEDDAKGVGPFMMAYAEYKGVTK